MTVDIIEFSLQIKCIFHFQYKIEDLICLNQALRQELFEMAAKKKPFTYYNLKQLF